jgi:Ca-activated chloride channel family protein
MSFIWKEMLLLLLLIPALIGAYILAQKRRQKYAIRYSSLSLVKQAIGKGPGLRRHIPPAFFIAAMTVLILSLARPSATLLLPSLQGMVILAMDSSGSMRADDVKPTRMDAAKAAAKAFVQKHAKNSRIGVVAFGGSANLVQPPTKDRDLVLAAIDRMTYQRGTAIGSGILASLNSILEELGEKQILPFGTETEEPLGTREGSFLPAVIVLLSDGQSNTGPLPLDMAAQAAAKGVRIYTVGLGSPDGTILNFYNMSIRVRLDEETLKRIADKTDGAYFKADSDTELENIYSNLGTKLVFKQEKTEITALFAALAAVLLVVSAALSLLWFNRLP